MAYIEWHGGIQFHHKTADLARRFKVSVREAVGIRGSLYAWAIDNRPGGRIERKLVAFACMEQERADDLTAALTGCGILDVVDENWLEIHDWIEYTKGYLKGVKDLERWHEKHGTRAKLALDSCETSGEQNRAEQNRTEQSMNVTTPTANARQHNGDTLDILNKALEAQALPATSKPKPGSSPAACLVSHWNGQPARAIITPAKGIRHIETAVARGITLQNIEAAFWDQKRCAGKKLYEVIDELAVAISPDIKDRNFKETRDRNGPRKV